MEIVNSVFDCEIIELSKVFNESGSITFVENQQGIGFNIERVYYLYDIPGGESRGGHAHKALKQLIVASSGSFEITLNDGYNSRTLKLNNPSEGLVLVPGIWRELGSFSSGATCLVLASMPYDENDYFRNYEEFKKYIHGKHGK